MSRLDKMTKDPRPLYLISLLVVAGPLIYPFIVPLSISQWTYGIYNFIEKMDPGERIIITGSWSFKFSEYYPQLLALMEHCIDKKLRIVIIEADATIPAWTAEAFKELDIAHRMQYGVDYVDIGYLPGGEVMVAGLCKDFHAIVKTDFYGNDIAQLSITKDVVTIRDFGAVIVITGSADSQYWLNQAWAPYGTPVAHALSAAKVVDSEAYFRAGSIFGILNGIRGAAEYETLVNRPGVGLGQMASVSMSHLLLIGILILGALITIQKRLTEGQKK